MRTWKLSGLLLLAATAAGCADLSSLSPPSSRKATAPPERTVTAPPVLSPQSGRAEEERQRRETALRIQEAEQTVLQVDQGRLPKDQQATYATVRSFIANAKEALSAQDFLRASNLAEKAQLLANDLLQTVQ